MTKMNHIDPGGAELRRPKPDASLLKRITDAAFSEGGHAE